MNPGYHANKYQMNLVLRLVSVCIKFPEKCNQNVIVTIKKRSDFWSNLLIFSVGMTGFEPATTRPPDVYSNRAELHPDGVWCKPSVGFAVQR